MAQIPYRYLHEDWFMIEGTCLCGHEYSLHSGKGGVCTRCSHCFMFGVAPGDGVMLTPMPRWRRIIQWLHDWTNGCGARCDEGHI